MLKSRFLHRELSKPVLGAKRERTRLDENGKAKEDKGEGRMAQGQLERMVSGFGEKVVDCTNCRLCPHRLNAVSSPK